MAKPKAIVEKNICLACGGCISICPEDAITMISSKATIEQAKCIGCGICLKTCPIAAIHWEDKKL